MAGESEKLSKDQLREDEFVEWIMDAVEYVKERSQLFAYGVVAVVGAILLINYLVESKDISRVEASNLLGEFMMAEQSGQLAEATRVGEQLVSSYTGTPAAAQGTVFLANIHYAEGRFAEAKNLYQQYINNYEPLDILAHAAQSGLGACLEAEGQLLEAAKHYESYAAQESGSIRGAMALMEAARVFGAVGNRDKQKSLLEDISTNFEQYPIALQARSILAML